MNDLSGQISGYFLHFNPEEMEVIKEGLEERGYDICQEGLKAYILESLDEEFEETATDRVLYKLQEYLKNNPDKVNLYGSVLKNAGKNIFDKILKQKRTA